MLTVMPCSASSLTTGTTRDSSTRGSTCTGPSRLAADVDYPRAFGGQCQTVCHGTFRIEITPAIRERVVSDVQNPHNPHRCADSLAQDEVERFGSRRGIGFELATHRRRSSDGTGLADTAHRHAQVLSLDDDD